MTNFPGITSENVAKKYNISRRAQDEFAASSYQKAEAAQKAGLFDAEIYPLTVKVTDPKTGSETSVTVKKDDGVRPGTTVETLSKLKPAFSKDGSTHAGNASQVSDGAAAVILARRSVAEKHGLPIVGKFVAGTVVGVPPAIMGIGPAVAIPKLLNKTGLTIDDIDIFEINEAFASQALYSVQVWSRYYFVIDSVAFEDSDGKSKSQRWCDRIRTSFGHHGRTTSIDFVD